MRYNTEIRKFIIDNFYYGQDAQALEDDTSFLENGIIDSTGVLELVSFIQEQYAIHVSDDELIPDNLDSLNKVSSYLHRKLVQSGNGAGSTAVAFTTNAQETPTEVPAGRIQGLSDNRQN